MTMLAIGFILCIAVVFMWLLCSRLCVLPCPSWLSWMVELDNPFFSINRASTIIKNLDVQPGITVIDIGCGPGRVTIPLAKILGHSGTITALDVQSEMLVKVRRKAQQAGLTNIAYVQANIDSSDLAKDTYDRALLVTVLGEIPDQTAALRHIFHILKPGGLLSITEIILDPHYQSKGHVLTLAQSVGFKEKKLFGNWAAYTILLEKAAS